MPTATSFEITSPTEGQTFDKATTNSNLAITVKGSAQGRKGGKKTPEDTYGDFSVLFNNKPYTGGSVVVVEDPHDDYHLTWSLSASIPDLGALTIIATATETETKFDDNGDPIFPPTTRNVRTLPVNVTVQVDQAAPTLTISKPEPPAAGDPVPVDIPEAGCDLFVQANATDNFGVDKVEASIDDEFHYHPLVRVPSDPYVWETHSAHIAGTPWLSGLRKLFVKATDAAGNFSEQSLDIKGKDVDGPVEKKLSPQSGRKIAWSGQDTTTIDVSGDLTDMQTGVKSVTCKLLDKTGNQVVDEAGKPVVVEKTFSPASPGTVSFTGTLPVTASGWYSIECEFRDYSDSGNKTSETISDLEVAESFSPVDINDLLGSRQYLAELLKFINVNFSSDGAGVTSDNLKDVFRQEFERLAKQPDADIAQHPVNQVRLCIEVLRSFLEDNSGNATDDFESEYSLLAYQIFLRQMGSSYEELRLSRGAEDEKRMALAERLGINVKDLRWPDYLDSLLLEPKQVTEVEKKQITEANLEHLFGLIDTTKGPFEIHTSPTLLDWQESQLQASWVDQDQALVDPIIDPDVIGKNDLASTNDTDPAFTLWTKRYKAVNPQYQAIKANRENETTALDGLKRIVNDALSHIINDPATPTNLVPCNDDSGKPLVPLEFLACLDKQQKNGKDIQPVLDALYLDVAALRYLLRIIDLASSTEAIVTESEWEDVYQILTHVWKDEQRKSWRAEEAGLAIGPSYFKLYHDEPPSLPCTGVKDGALLSSGGEDPNWDLTDPDGKPNLKVYVTQKKEPLWVPNDDRSQWISPIKIATDGSDPGTYTYGANFDLSGWDLTTVQIIATIAVDDSVTDVKVNGTSLGQTATGFQAFTTIPLSGPFQDGDNRVEFLVDNVDIGTNPTGLRVELSFAAPPQRVQLPRWRVSDRARRDWQSILRARIDQEAGLQRAFDMAIQATEEVALPVLRDALIKVIGVSQKMAPSTAADWLSDRLLIETKGGGWRLTTRALQAIETLQSLVFSLRTGRLDNSHPAHGWQLMGDGSGDYQDHFDEEWQWAGNYEAWRGAMMVFYYPENILLPSLRDKGVTTQQFKDLLKAMRAKSTLTPQAARDLAKDYLSDVLDAYEETLPPFNGGPFVLTDEWTDSQLAILGAYADPILNDHNFSPEFTEIFYFVPIALALQLQKSGEYTAALDWFQTVYAYNLPPGQRKIYLGLRKENNNAPILSHHEHWLRDDLNPHVLAEGRAKHSDSDPYTGSNPYTRYTLMSLARCFLEFGDSEFTYDSGESLARARELYLTARSILAAPDFDQIQPDGEETLLSNPVLAAVRSRIENQLAKLRQGRNIAGMKREIEIPTPPKTEVGLPTVGSGGQLVIPGARRRQRPTPYRFSILMDRSKQLVGIAQQIEAAYLAALEKRDAENYNLKKAGFDLKLAEAGNQLQALRQTEATDGETLVTKQKSRATKQKETYKDWIDRGLSVTENLLIQRYTEGGFAKQASAGLANSITVTQSVMTAAVAAASITLPPTAAGAAAAAGGAVAVGVESGLKSSSDAIAIGAETEAAILSIKASHERLVNDWQLGYDLADIDEQIADQQESIAKDHTAIVLQEGTIASAQTAEARDMANYLANKFTSAELYEWMSGVLGGVYSYFLHQATAVASLAESQLTFERQEAPTSFIQSDYWEAPSDGATTSGNNQATDRRGLTGSARLLQDIYQLDQFAFESNKRKLNLAHTISLAALDPYAFAVFRETGVLNFITPMRIFDEAFPGHYLRLIKRVRTSVVALIPPVQGIRATLTASGVSRVAIGGDVFQETTIRRDPELVALTSPVNATGVFELDAQAELLMPFESMGVDTGWEFVMPRASNPFDFETIADVMITMEYTALFNDDYRRQVIQGFDSLVSADRPYSIRNDFPDIWYDLNNAAAGTSSADIRFRSERSHFPPNLDEDIKIQELLFAVLPKADDIEVEGDVFLSYTPDVGLPMENMPGSALLRDLRINTRLLGTGEWGKVVQGKRAVGEWHFTVHSDLIAHLKSGDIDDLLIVTTFSGNKPAWPV